MLLAHEGGWDEALFVIIPLLVVFALIWMVKRRAAKSINAIKPAAAPNPDSDPLDPRAE
jgi:hypothetical protein